MKEFDFSGMACPGPVIETKKFVDSNPETGSLKVTVDNMAASENVSRFLSNSGFAVNVEKEGETFNVMAQRSGDFVPGKTETEEKPQKKTDKDNPSTLIMFTNRTLGSGNLELGGKLMVNFIKTLNEMDNLWRLVFVNEAVMLTTGDAETIDSLKELESKGVSILVCGTCLDFFGILEKKEVGETTNMLDIVTSLEVADKVINY